MLPNAASSLLPPSGEMKYKGVRRRRWGRWVSEIRLPNSRKRIWLGSYGTPEKAARAFDAAYVCLRGPGGADGLNFPGSPPAVSPTPLTGGAHGRGVTRQPGGRHRRSSVGGNQGV
ncbi:hypothetical protein BAE44_0023043 [Dichanthelium oligosanthes]|uniref:AP2/ERF domain-containing protein n=1 Tax=Dichanthelium oligosanthes TaxID=888268 RepID=A0A1E5USY7_9POAL|nr:hypothetical protein BAE44_0023043 [Dichanthelium oligosanthes]